MQTFSPHDLRALAVAAHVDPRTATRWLAGLSVVPAVAHRLAQCAAELGMVRSSQALEGATTPFSSTSGALGISYIGHHSGVGGPR